MALFETHHLGKTISPELSDYLKQFTSIHDRITVSEKTSVGPSTIRDLVYRTNVLTINNAVSIVELMKIAVNNCTNTIQNARQAKQFLIQETA